MSNELTVREVLTKINERDGYDIGNDSLIETLTELGECVWSSPNIDMRRWYGIKEVVYEIEGHLIKFGEYIITGDGSMSDMDLEYNIDSMKIVERKERVITEIYYE